MDMINCLAKVAERQKQRETLGTNLDSVKTRSLQAEEEKMNKMKAYQEQSKISIGAASSSDPVKAQKERAELEKAAQLKQYEEMVLDYIQNKNSMLLMFILYPKRLKVAELPRIKAALNQLTESKHTIKN